MCAMLWECVCAQACSCPRTWSRHSIGSPARAAGAVHGEAPLREFETTFIVQPEISDEACAELVARLDKILDKHGARRVMLDDWGKRKLAYEIRKQLKGIYLYWDYLATTGVVEEFERNLRMLDSVIRYFTVKVDSDIDPEARPSEVDEETYVKAATTAADEEELMLGRPVLDDDDDDSGGSEDSASDDAPVASDDESSPAPADSASMVVIFCPGCTADTGSAQLRIGTPSRCTVQAPHCATPQPYLVPVSPSCSRSTHSSGVAPSTSTLTTSPFTFNLAMSAPSLVSKRRRAPTMCRARPARGNRCRFFKRDLTSLAPCFLRICDRLRTRPTSQENMRCTSRGFPPHLIPGP